MEEQLGADLYVNITVRLGGRPKSKGFLIQAKKSRRREGLAQQCRKMRAQTDSAYAWIYEDDGCWAIDAQTVIDHPNTALRGLKRRSVTACSTQFWRAPRATWRSACPTMRTRPQRSIGSSTGSGPRAG